MASTLTKFHVGDLVMVDPQAVGVNTAFIGKRFVVTKVNPKNVVAFPALEDGTRIPHERGINYPKDILLPYDPTAPAVVAPASVAISEPYQPPLADGTIVSLAKPFKDFTVDTPLVVLNGETRGGKVKVTRVGGDGYRYLSIRRQGLVERDLGWLVRTLGSQGHV